MYLFDKINFPSVQRSWTGLWKFLHLLKKIPGQKQSSSLSICSCFCKVIYCICNPIFPVSEANQEISHIRRSNHPHLQYSALQLSSHTSASKEKHSLEKYCCTLSICTGMSQGHCLQRSQEAITTSKVSLYRTGK